MNNKNNTKLYARNEFYKNERVDRIGIRNELLLRRHPRRHLRHVVFDIVQVYDYSLSTMYFLSNVFVHRTKLIK